MVQTILLIYLSLLTVLVAGKVYNDSVNSFNKHKNYIKMRNSNILWTPLC